MNIPCLPGGPPPFVEERQPVRQVSFDWLLIPIVVAFWWPLQSYWMSDDFIAINYAQDLGRALSDFTGNQYDLPGMVWFYRPLITLSFFLDAAMGGGGPFVSHLNNALLHGLNALLLARLCRPYLGLTNAFACGLLWGLSPANFGAVSWAVGRVDVISSLFILGTCLFAQRWSRGLGSLWPGLITFALALMSKESALVTPGLVAIIAFGNLRGEGRVKKTIQATWPFALLLAIYLCARTMLFGRLGGYEGAWPDPLQVLVGLGESSGHLLNPLGYAGREFHELVEQFWLLGFLPALIGLGILLMRRNFGLPTGLLALYLCALVPIVQFLPGSENIKDLRLFYLPSMALFVLIAAGGPFACFLALLAWTLPALEMRADYAEQAERNQTVHKLIIDGEKEAGDELMFVSGLQRQNRKATVLAFHLGVDRLLEAPFTMASSRLFALRPLSQSPGARRLPYGDERGLPIGRTFSIVNDSILAALPTVALRDLPLQMDSGVDLSTENLRRVLSAGGKLMLRMPGHRSPFYRVSVFTAGGYLTCLVPDSGQGAAGEGSIDLFALLREGRVDSDGEQRLWMALRQPLTLDLDRRLPVLVEAGEMQETSAGSVFTATHANRSPLMLRFDREYPEGIRGQD